ncbi:hypothetical protein ACVMAJ_006865 [Bradyrhizobium sp. USDA 4448]
MSKKPKVSHEYHAGKDRLDIKIKGYSLSKETRHKVIKNVIKALEASPDRLIVEAKKFKKEKDKKTANAIKNKKQALVGD